MEAYIDQDGILSLVADSEDDYIKIKYWKKEKKIKIARHYSFNKERIFMKNQDKLIELLEKQPDLSAKLLEALESERFFMTITYQHVIDPEQPQNDLQHFWKQEKFEDNDVLHSIQHITADWTAKKRPQAAIPNDGNWH